MRKLLTTSAATILGITTLTLGILAAPIATSTAATASYTATRSMMAPAPPQCFEGPHFHLNLAKPGDICFTGAICIDTLDQNGHTHLIWCLARGEREIVPIDGSPRTVVYVAALKDDRSRAVNNIAVELVGWVDAARGHLWPLTHPARAIHWCRMRSPHAKTVCAPVVNIKFVGTFKPGHEPKHPFCLTDRLVQGEGDSVLWAPKCSGIHHIPGDTWDTWMMWEPENPIGGVYATNTHGQDTVLTTPITPTYDSNTVWLPQNPRLAGQQAWYRLSLKFLT